MDLRPLETAMWGAAKARDAAAFLQLVRPDAVMICGGYPCSGSQYAQIITGFDLAQYQLSDFETVAQSGTVCQVRYRITTQVHDPRNTDLAGTFHVTSTWQQDGGAWKLVFNMDVRAAE